MTESTEMKYEHADPECLETGHLCYMFGVTRACIQKWRERGMPYVKVGRGTKRPDFRYNGRDVVEWYGRVIAPTLDPHTFKPIMRT